MWEEFCKNCWNIGPSDGGTLSKQPSVPAYYIRDWLISNLLYTWCKSWSNLKSWPNLSAHIFLSSGELKSNSSNLFGEISLLHQLLRLKYKYVTIICEWKWPKLINGHSISLLGYHKLLFLLWVFATVSCHNTVP